MVIDLCMVACVPKPGRASYEERQTAASTVPGSNLVTVKFYFEPASLRLCVCGCMYENCVYVCLNLCLCFEFIYGAKGS